jgi:peptidyl-prolyl cis-trans isomerase D
MLRFFSKFQRSRNFVLFAFCLLLLVGLVIFYIPNTSIDPTGRFNAGAEDRDVEVARVGSQKILAGQYRAQLEQMSLQFGRGNNIPMSALRSLGADKQVLDNLIGGRLLLDMADELKLTATDRELAEVIKEQFSDGTGKFIGAEEYKRRLRLQGVSVETFEMEQRNAITSRKVRDYFVSTPQVGDREIEERFRDDNTKIDVVYAIVDLETIRKKFQPSEQELREYYQSNLASFKAVEPTRQVEYLFISTDDAAKIVPISEDELRQEYDARKQFEYRVSIIRIDVPTTEDEDIARQKINDLNQRVRGAQGVPGEDFATVARGNSQDPSRAQGGDIGWVRKDLNKTSDWRQRPYTNSLSVGMIDGPFRDGRSWYVLKVTEERAVPFAQLRDTLRATISNNKAFQKASQLADLAYEKATEYKDLRRAAEEIAKELKVSPASLVRNTPYFKVGDALPSLGKGAGFASNPAFEEATSTLGKGEIGDKVSIPGGQAIPRVVDLLKDGVQLTFDQARNQAEQKLRAEKEPRLVQIRAQEILRQSKSPADLERLAKAEGLEVSKDTNFESYTFPTSGGARNQSMYQARQALVKLNGGEVSQLPVKLGTSYLIFAASKRTEADLSLLPSQRSTIQASILNERQTSISEAVVKSLRSRYEKEGKVKIYQERIDKIFAEEQPQ